MRERINLSHCLEQPSTIYSDILGLRFHCTETLYDELDRRFCFLKFLHYLMGSLQPHCEVALVSPVLAFCFSKAQTGQ